MKTAIYIEDGTVQLVITPESNFEKDAIRVFGCENLQAKMWVGGFYDCRGGWVRQNEYSLHENSIYSESSDRSLIIRVADKWEAKK